MNTCRNIVWLKYEGGMGDGHILSCSSSQLTTRNCSLWTLFHLFHENRTDFSSDSLIQGEILETVSCSANFISIFTNTAAYKDRLVKPYFFDGTLFSHCIMQRCCIIKSKKRNDHMNSPQRKTTERWLYSVETPSVEIIHPHLIFIFTKWMKDFKLTFIINSWRGTDLKHQFTTVMIQTLLSRMGVTGTDQSTLNSFFKNIT